MAVTSAVVKSLTCRGPVESMSFSAASRDVAWKTSMLMSVSCLLMSKADDMAVYGVDAEGCDIAGSEAGDRERRRLFCCGERSVSDSRRRRTSRMKWSSQ